MSFLSTQTDFELDIREYSILSAIKAIVKLIFKPQLFVFDEITELCYLMASGQDDDLLMWVLEDNKGLTILKGDFAEFHDTFLEKLSCYYPVFFAGPKSKKAVPYSLEMVSGETFK